MDQGRGKRLIATGCKQMRSGLRRYAQTCKEHRLPECPDITVYIERLFSLVLRKTGKERPPFGVSLSMSAL